MSDYRIDADLSGMMCYPLYINEEYFSKKGDRLRRLELQWDMFQLPLDADIVISLFGKEGEKYYSVTDVNGSRGGRGIFINERFFEQNLCVGDFVSILWADGIKLPLTNWAIRMYHYE